MNIGCNVRTNQEYPQKELRDPSKYRTHDSCRSGSGGIPIGIPNAMQLCEKSYELQGISGETSQGIPEGIP